MFAASKLFIHDKERSLVLPELQYHQLSCPDLTRMEAPDLRELC